MLGLECCVRGWVQWNDCVFQEFHYPDNVGMPIGGEGNPEFFHIELHYDNPTGKAGNYNIIHVLTHENNEV